MHLRAASLGKCPRLNSTFKYSSDATKHVSVVNRKLEYGLQQVILILQHLQHVFKKVTIATILAATKN